MGRAVVAGITCAAGGQCSGDGLLCPLADLILEETTLVTELAAELVVPDVQGLGLCASCVGCELNAKVVGKHGLEGVPISEIAQQTWSPWQEGVGLKGIGPNHTETGPNFFGLTALKKDRQKNTGLKLDKKIFFRLNFSLKKKRSENVFTVIGPKYI